MAVPVPLQLTVKAPPARLGWIPAPTSMRPMIHNPHLNAPMKAPPVKAPPRQWRIDTLSMMSVSDASASTGAPPSSSTEGQRLQILEGLVSDQQQQLRDQQQQLRDQHNQIQMLTLRYNLINRQAMAAMLPHRLMHPYDWTPPEESMMPAAPAATAEGSGYHLPPPPLWQAGAMMPVIQQPPANDASDAAATLPMMPADPAATSSMAQGSGHQVAPPPQPPPIGQATLPLKICSTPGCTFNENIQGPAYDFAGFCCWCCQQHSLNKQPFARHGKRCQRYKVSWLW